LIVILVLTAITVSVNLIIRSPRVQELCHQKAEQILGVPVTMGKLSFNLFTGFHLSSITITDSSHHSVQASLLDFMPTWKSLMPAHWRRFDKWTGTLNIARVSFNQGLSLQHFKARIRKRSDSFLIDPFSSRIANGSDGKLTGSFLLQEENAHSPYQLNVAFSEISLKELIKGVPAIEGKVQGTFFMKGMLEDSEKKEGEGTLEIVGMQFKGTGPLAQIGQLLGIQELQLLQFNKAIAKYTVTPHQLVVKSCQLDSNNFMIHGHGVISYDGRLHLSALLLLNGKLQSRLQGLIPAASLVPSDIVGFVALPFEITGSLDHPQNNLLQNVALPAINTPVQGLIQQIFKF
jgi:hypothetical protein